MTPLNISDPRTARLWALEPAVAPMKARYALLIGVVFGALLLGLTQGPLPDSALEEWHGNVAASQTMRQR